MTARAVLACLLVSGVCAFGGPPYPVTAAWFRDRFTYGDWNKTLAEFQTQGGDTVFLRAPPIIERTRDDLLVRTVSYIVNIMATMIDPKVQTFQAFV